MQVAARLGPLRLRIAAPHVARCAGRMRRGDGPTKPALVAQVDAAHRLETNVLAAESFTDRLPHDGAIPRYEPARDRVKG